jgi:PhnB protein
MKNGAAAIEFYKRAFGVIELMRVDGPDGIIVAELSLDGATFFLSDESPESGNFSPESIDGTTMRIELTVADPDSVAQLAIKAGAKEMFPVTDHDYGYRQGRIVDPFGHHWVIGRKIQP